MPGEDKKKSQTSPLATAGTTKRCQATYTRQHFALEQIIYLEVGTRLLSSRPKLGQHLLGSSPSEAIIHDGSERK
jgi:hypothetical protein